MKIVVRALLAAVMVFGAKAQQVGELSKEEHLALPSQTCTASGCKTEATSLVLDATYRWLHQVGNQSPCLNSGTWNATVCPDSKTCAKNCAYEGVTKADYATNYGVATSGNAVTLKYSDKYSPRVYLMASETKYRMFNLLNQELAFDIDTSTLECGMNGALYFVSMKEDGGISTTNKAGAQYGTGYCDAQCPEVSFIDGEVNMPKSAKTTSGQYGFCCPEFDVWEANKISAVVTSHPSSKPGTYKCDNDADCGTGGSWGKGITDKGGCGFNSYANGDHTYYGPGSSFKVDSTKKFTIVTQFITDDKTSSGNLVEIKRFYMQDGKVIANSKTSSGVGSITDAYCGSGQHTSHGGLKQMGAAFKDSGMVMAFSLWADSSADHMSWLDTGNAGSCAVGSGDPAELKTKGISITFSNIRAGAIGSTTSDKASNGSSTQGNNEDATNSTATVSPATTATPVDTGNATATAAPVTTTAPVSTTVPTTTPKPTKKVCRRKTSARRA